MRGRGPMSAKPPNAPPRPARLDRPPPPPPPPRRPMSFRTGDRARIERAAAAAGQKPSEWLSEVVERALEAEDQATRARTQRT